LLTSYDQFVYHEVNVTQLTFNQVLHREYLGSPVWKAKREEAINHYGPVCSRCKEYGTDVHHKTYIRWGGNELMEDLEIMCRECHDAHHRVEKATRQKKIKKKGLRREAIYRYLSPSQKKILIDRFSLSGDKDLYGRIVLSNSLPIINEALKILGCDYAYGPKQIFRPPVSKKEREKNLQRVKRQEEAYKLAISGKLP